MRFQMKNGVASHWLGTPIAANRTENYDFRCGLLFVEKDRAELGLFRRERPDLSPPLNCHARR